MAKKTSPSLPCTKINVLLSVHVSIYIISYSFIAGVLSGSPFTYISIRDEWKNELWASSVNYEPSLPDRCKLAEVRKMGTCTLCGKETVGFGDIYCGRCDKIVGDVNADLVVACRGDDR